MSRLFHRHAPGEPCPFMVDMLHKRAEGRAGWLTNLYVLAHVARCTPCRKFLASIETLLDRLKEAKQEEIPADTEARLLAKFDVLDKE